jgi:outer membrane receptor protein involved in Fe transport
LLPSANIIYKIKNDENAPINLRVNYSKAIARPSIRELTETANYDYEFRTFVFGNKDLKTVSIDNYDFRLESYFKNGDNISVSLFYKYFTNHIEMVQNPQGFSWQNTDVSYVKGIEIDGRKKIIKGLEFRANLTFTNSMTTLVQYGFEVTNGQKVLGAIDTLSRQMSGQAPYVLNGILSYALDSIGLNLAVGYNVPGPRLVIASSEPEFTPNVFEMPRHLLDFKVSKTIGKYFTVSVAVKDILNAPVRTSYDLPDGYNIDFANYRFGANYNLSVSYKL